MVSDLDMSLKKMSDFVSLPLFGFTLVIKLRNFDFDGHLNALIFFYKMMSVLIMSVLIILLFLVIDGTRHWLSISNLF